MTICAAMLCWDEEKHDSILCISDRLFTFSDGTSYEPERQTKAFGMCPANAYVFFAGDAQAHSEVLEFRTRRKQIADNITDLKQLADLHFDNLEDYGRNKVEGWGGVDVIIAGFDNSGANIFRLSMVPRKAGESFIPGERVWENQKGFCAIGEGDRDFQLFVRHSGYDRFCDLHKALFLIYAAKKWSERIYQSISTTTDVFRIYQNGKKIRIHSEILDGYYRSYLDLTAQVAEKLRKDERLSMPSEESSAP